jgi:hypothetical protein
LPGAFVQPKVSSITLFFALYLRASIKNPDNFVAEADSKLGVKLGEHKNIGHDEIREILHKCWK